MPKRILIIVSLLFLVGCSVRRGVVTKTPEGIIFDMKSDGKMTYKDSEVEASMDTRKKAGIIEDIIKLYTIRTITKDD
jgi:uncharacterized protein YcfL